MKTAKEFFIDMFNAEELELELENSFYFCCYKTIIKIDGFFLSTEDVKITTKNTKKIIYRLGHNKLGYILLNDINDDLIYKGNDVNDNDFNYINDFDDFLQKMKGKIDLFIKLNNKSQENNKEKVKKI